KPAFSFATIADVLEGREFTVVDTSRRRVTMRQFHPPVLGGGVTLMLEGLDPEAFQLGSAFEVRPLRDARANMALDQERLAAGSKTVGQVEQRSSRLEPTGIVEHFLTPDPE